MKFDFSAALKSIATSPDAPAIVKAQPSQPIKEKIVQTPNDLMPPDATKPNVTCPVCKQGSIVDGVLVGCVCVAQDQCDNGEDDPPPPVKSSSLSSSVNAPVKKGMIFRVPAHVAAEAKEVEATLESANERIANIGSTIGLDSIPEDGCRHLCECQTWWSHGPKLKCRYPDMLNYGKCPACLHSDETGVIIGTASPDAWTEKDGKLIIDPITEKQLRNDERSRCKDMSPEQLTYHIQFYARQIEELRIRSLETRKMSAERIEEETEGFTDEQRAKFIQDLRNSTKAKKPRVKKEATPKKASSAKQKEADLVVSLKASGKSAQEASLIASWMIKTGKSQAQVEAFLND